MERAHIEIVTISREFGAGGSELASRLGTRLGWRVLDDEVTCTCAKRLRIEPEAAERLREHTPTLLARLTSALLVAPPEAPGIDSTHLLRIDAIAEAAYESIMDAARTPPLIVVGFGTQCMFAENPNALHVRAVAPIGARVARLRARYGWDETTATTRARKMDDDRRRYVQRYFHRDVLDPMLYDVQINTGRTTIDEAAQLIEQLVRDHDAQARQESRREQGAGAVA